MKPFGRVSQKCMSAICAIALLVTSFAYALGQQTAPKRALTHQDYDSWHSIQSPQISRDGKFIAYAYMAQDGDSEIVVRNLASGAEWRAPRGYRPPAPPPDDSIPNVAEIIAANARLVRPAFTADSRFVVFSIEPTKAEVNKAKKAGSSPTVREGSGNNPATKEGLKNALGVMDTSTGQVTRIERVKSFQVPEDGSGFIAYMLEAKPNNGPDVRDGAKGPSTQPLPGVGPVPSSQASPTAAGSPASQRGSSPTVREGSQGSSPSPRSSKKKEYGTEISSCETRATGPNELSTMPSITP